MVISDGGKLVALIYPDYDLLAREGHQSEETEQIMNDNIVQLNKELPAYSQLTRVRLMSEEFEKTPKRSIKRYLYQHG